MVKIDLDPEVAQLPTDAICLDAAAPFINPQHVRKFLPDLRAGGVDAVLATVASIENCTYATSQLGCWHALERSSELPFRLCTSVADIRAAKSDGVLAVVLHFQGTAPLAGNVDLVDAYHALGVRVMQLTYNVANLVGDGCTESRNGGLTDFGRKVVRRMVDLHMLVDISHVGARTSLEAIALAEGAVVATHANARTLCDTPRNLADEQIKAVVAAGGVIGLVAFPAFVSGNPNPTVDDLLKHADYLSELVGPEHIGLGFDFAEETQDDYASFGYDERFYPNPPWVYPKDIRGWVDTPNVTAGLRARGYSDGQIRGILGENFLRVFGRVWSG